MATYYIVPTDRESVMLEELGESGLKVVMYLYKVGEKPLDPLRRELHIGYTALYRALHTLDRYGLVSERPLGVKRLLSLTEKGKRVAEKLLEAEEILLKEEAKNLSLIHI